MLTLIVSLCRLLKHINLPVRAFSIRMRPSLSACTRKSAKKLYPLSCILLNLLTEIKIYNTGKIEFFFHEI